MCRAIKEGKNFSNERYTLFRSATNNEDIVAKYMFLYMVLLLIHRDKDNEECQKEVDKFIRSKFPKEKHEYKEWDDTKRTETIYTRLRNQVAHYRGVKPEVTRKQMKEKIDELIKLVKMSIEFDQTE